ncbi:MAG: nitrous oxide reductase family maturation protein NosD [Chloroflexota bacterium]|nr:nitrous oxide reductase family maturation protein NosD [Chloroflexota bacterium]
MWLAPAVIACVLLAGAVFVPLWKMQLVAPQYPKGLVMYAYGYKFEGAGRSTYNDVTEINELNHYIGMKKIGTVTEMKLFLPGVAALIAGTVAISFVAWRRRWLRALVALGFWAMPLFFVADLQYWLYNYGHTMDPTAALNVHPFTPRVFGATKVMNFHSETAFQTGFYLMVAAALVITVVPLAAGWRQRRRAGHVAATRDGAAVDAGRTLVLKALVLAPVIVAAAALTAVRASAQTAGPGAQTLQQRIDAAAPDDIVIVEGGVFHESIVINKPISLIGRGWPVIDGGGEGDVVTVAADDVVLSGFVVRNSSKDLSREPADIKVKRANRVKIKGNRLQDAHFGMHVTGSKESVFEGNVIDTGGRIAIERRGHGIYLWEVSRSTVHGNTVRNAADGIHLEFSDDNGVGANDVRQSRYALHLMYAHGNRIIGNTFRDNLAGAVLMFSHDLLVKDNELSSNRKGATGAGMLIKDDDNLFVEGNRVLRNTYGMTVEGSPQSAGATAIFRRNVVALNDAGLGLMSNAPITFVENAMIDNTVQVRALGGDLTSRALSGHGGPSAAGIGGGVPHGIAWSSAGRGNYWSDYRGYDADGDGVGDLPYRPRPPFAGLLADHDALRLFQYTPAQQAIDIAADLFPVYRYDAVMEDSRPLMEPPAGLGVPHGGGVNVRLLAASVALIGLTAAGVGFAAGADARRTLGHRLAPRGRLPRGAAA